MVTKTYNNISFFDTEGSLEPLVILHGWKQNKESWKPVIELLSSSFRIICPDLPGFGHSIGDQFLSFSPIDYAKSISDLLTSLEISSYNILTHSFGGRIGVVMAHNNPESVKILILFSSPGLELEPENSISLKKIVLSTGKHFVKHIPDNSLINKLKRSIGSQDYNEASELKEIFLKAVNFDIKPYLQGIKAKTFILWGDRDTELDVQQSQRFLKYIKGSEVYIFKGYGHFAHLEASALFAHNVKKFLLHV